jgi:Na+-transporting methylmalonyl-CoA/oxaloacetate decarboxylase gamma subunit
METIIALPMVRVRALTLTQIGQLLASDRSFIVMVFNRLGLVVVVLITLLAIGRLWSQEAVEAEKSPKPAEETSAEPSTSPEKSTKKEATAEKPARGVEETMRPEEFKAAGLDKLSEDELQHLDAWLKGYRQSTQKKAAEKAQVQAQEEIKQATAKATEEAKKTAMTRIDTAVSRVDGNIEGIKGHTVIRLEDGTIWKQANADDRYRATNPDRPPASVIRTSFGYKMRIEGMPEFYVDPVR